VTLEPSAPEIPKVPEVDADQVEKWVLAVPAVGAKVIAVMLVLAREAAAFQVQAWRVEDASEAPVVPGSAVLSWTNAITLVVPPDRESSAWFAAVGSSLACQLPFLLRPRFLRDAASSNSAAAGTASLSTANFEARIPTSLP
jgi:hypothetical protein